jgi:predicted Rossmann fold flavoprotein
MVRRDAFDVVVIGGGPSGLTAAIRAARNGAQVVLIDRKREPGTKIVLSGGGRCNVLPVVVESSDYVTDSSPNTLRKILRSWPLDEVRAFLERDLGLTLREESETGKLFPVAGGGRGVRDRLLGAARDAGVRLMTGRTVRSIAPGSPVRVGCAEGDAIQAARVVLATGGLSYPKTGSDGLGLEIAREIGHAVVEPYPALVALHGNAPGHQSLAGVSIHVALTVGRGKEAARSAGALLFTHRGYSGPAVMNVGHLAARARRDGWALPIAVSWGDRTAEEWTARLSPGRRTVRRVLSDILPERLVVSLLAELGLLDAKTATLPKADRRRLIDRLTAYPLHWTSTDGFDKAEVTGGGVRLSEVDPRTLESRIVPGLHFCGEILDAFGPIGGHNFLWAFVTGKLAGDGAASD